MLVAPSEPPLLRSLGTVSDLPERCGVDFLWPAKSGLIGVQRKEWGDLMASVQSDDRLAREVAQMRGSLDTAVLLIEGRPIWTTDGKLLDSFHRGWTRKRYRNLLRGRMLTGILVDYSDSLADTVACLEEWKSLTEKEGTGLIRPKPAGEWGKPSSREWKVFLLESFDGISKVTATRILDYFGGELPLAWTCAPAELTRVPGVGPKRLKSLSSVVGWTQT